MSKVKDYEKASVIIDKTCEVFGLPKEQVNQARRETLFLDTRSAIYYFLRDKTLLTYPEIAQLFEKDHATIINGVDRAYKRLRNNLNYSEKILILEEELKEYSHE